jgi:hypothetical protein
MLSTLFVALFAILIGAAFCLLGYRVFLVLLPIVGFFAGFYLGAEVTSLILGTGFLGTAAAFVVGLIVGLLLAVFSYAFYFVGVILVAAIIGYGLGAGLMTAVGFDPGFLTALVGVVFAMAVIIATLLFNLQKYVIILLTALAGANGILLGVLLLIGRVQLEAVTGAGNMIRPVLADSWFWAIVWLAVAIAGIVMQIRSNRSWEFEQSRYVENWG